MSIKFTLKQIEILRIIKNRRSDGELVDIYDICSLATYDVKPDAMKHSLNVLINAGYVQKMGKVKRGYKHAVTIYTVTSAGYSLV